jgi:hypothetical protein
MEGNGHGELPLNRCGIFNKMTNAVLSQDGAGYTAL